MNRLVRGAEQDQQQATWRLRRRDLLVVPAAHGAIGDGRVVKDDEQGDRRAKRIDPAIAFFRAGFDGA
jgi:hypothetical protein